MLFFYFVICQLDSASRMLEYWFPTALDRAVISVLTRNGAVCVPRSPVPILCYPIYLTIAILRRMSTDLSSIDRKPAGSATNRLSPSPVPHPKLSRLTRSNAYCNTPDSFVDAPPILDASTSIARQRCCSSFQRHLCPAIENPKSQIPNRRTLCAGDACFLLS